MLELELEITGENLWENHQVNSPILMNQLCCKKKKLITYLNIAY